MKPRPLLDSIVVPQDLQRVPAAQLPALAAEIRAEILDTLAVTGGHLASNLGVVELTLALMRVFDVEHDQIVWDTGHQCYPYKLLTGRRALFQSLRQYQGCCGFPLRDESRYDVFGAGHAGTAISAALGLAVARDQKGEGHRVIAVVGDGALGCGVSLEGLNSVIENTRDFILVLNDNKMAIAPRVGALGKCLSRMLSGSFYNRLKRSLRTAVLKVPVVGGPIRRGISRLEELLKGVLAPPGLLFEELGIRYIGPIDGHDLPELLHTFSGVKALRQPLVIHVLTEKGRGFAQAEQAPELFHGVNRPAAPMPEKVQPAGAPGAAVDAAAHAPTFSSSLGDVLVRLMAGDKRLVAISAGMCHGTGLAVLRREHPNRLIDVGIAEEHAVVFAAGLAAAGQRPVVAIYATFMQRAMDYVLHDVCLQRLPVIFCLDRAGVVEDGATHHGIHDLGFWRALPHLAVLQPADAWELAQMLAAAVAHAGPVLIRYPRGSAAPVVPAAAQAALEWGRAAVVRPGKDVMIWAVGREVALALEVAADLAARGIDAGVVNPRFVMPFDQALLLEQARQMPLVTLENHVLSGGFASMVDEALLPLATAGAQAVRVLHRGWPTTVVPWGAESELRRECRLDRASLVADVAGFVGKREIK